MRYRSVVILACLVLAAPGRAGREDLVGARRARLERDPADAEALLALADHYEAEGESGYARRYLRAFLLLVLEHPGRIEAARRVAALRPAHPFVVAEDFRGEGGHLVYVNALDGTLAVRVPAGPYRRCLRPDHPADEDVTTEVRFDVHLSAFLADLHETPRAVWRTFVLESGFSVPAYWGEGAERFLALTQESTGMPWAYLGGTLPAPACPAWPLTFFEARALARAAGKRLPTEAEWEKAARGGIHLGEEEILPNPAPTRRHPWGDAPVRGPTGSLRAVAGGFPSDVDVSVDVDTMPEGASPYGCLHMLGNVQEWCADWYWWDADVMRLPPTNPRADSPDPTGEVALSRVCKGGYFNWGARELTIDARTPHTAHARSMALLFKCGLRGFADAPPLPEEVDESSDSRALAVPKPDPLDGARLLEEGLLALETGDRERAWRRLRAAARLLRFGPGRAQALRALAGLTPPRTWKRLADGRWRNLVDGGLAVAVGDLLVDVHEITEGQYLTFLAETARDAGTVVGVNDVRFGNGDLPAATLTPHEAEAYARWAGKRLPTRTEWMRIAHVDARPFPWGDAPVRGRAVVEASLTERAAECWDRRMPVGSLPDGASPEGIVDLVGNVAEWCADGPDPDARWLVGGDACRYFDVEDAEDFRASLEESADPASDLTQHAYSGARCVARRPSHPDDA